jgi:hypothetical protein
MYEYLLDNGMTREEYHFFLNNNLKHHCIMGNDYYQTNEHYVSADGSTRRPARSSATPSLPTSTTTATACRSCTPRPTCARALRRRSRALAAQGMGERAAGAQQRRAARRLHLVFADRPGRLGHALRENNGNVNALGLFDLDRKIRRSASPTAT